MGDSHCWYLSAIVFLPAIGALLLGLSLFIPRVSDNAVRFFTLLVTLVVFVISLPMVVQSPLTEQFDTSLATMQKAFSISWIPSFDIYYFMGLDGISFPLVILTAFVSVLAMIASWSITKHVRAYCILFLLLESGMLGVFMALDFFLFYVFWEVMLLPMYFLIGVWGGPRKEYAAIKFFLYTLVGSVLMLIAILMLYFNSDLRKLAEKDFEQGGGLLSELNLHETLSDQLGISSVTSSADNSPLLSVLRVGGEPNEEIAVRFTSGAPGNTEATYDAETRVVTVALAAGQDSAAAVVTAMKAAINREDSELKDLLDVQIAAGSDGSSQVVPDDGFTLQPYDASSPVHTFNLLALSAMGQKTKLFDKPLLFGWSLQHWAFVLLFIGFIIKVPSVPVHTWLPDAHVEAPTPISMILAGVLLKMGGYGILRICYPICPHAGYDLATIVCLIGVISMVYGAFAAMAQKDFKRLVAYSSVSHMGYVVLGMGVWSANSASLYNSDYWNMGVKGAMFQMIAHGISSAGMFFMVGVVYDRVHHRNLNEFGGLFAKMPLYSGLAIGIFFAGLGLPGLCGFIGEVFVVLSVWNFSYPMAIVSAAVVILTAGYILWALQRVYLGPEYRGPHGEALVPINMRELAVAVPLFFCAIWFGVYPHAILKYMDKTIDKQVTDLAEWTRDLDNQEKNAMASEDEAVAADQATRARQDVPALQSRRDDAAGRSLGRRVTVDPITDGDVAASVFPLDVGDSSPSTARDRL